MLVQGIEYDLDWKKFRPPQSVFIPCLDIAGARKELLAVTQRLRRKVVTKEVIENDVRGLRVWAK